MKPAELLSTITQGALLPLYYFYGDDHYLKEMVLRHLEKQGGFADHDPLNYEVHYGASASIPVIIDSARTLPFLGTRRFVLVKEAEKIPAARHKELYAYCGNPNKKTTLVFSGKEKETKGKEDKCPLRGDLLAAFQKNGLVQHIPLPHHRTEIHSWIQHLAREQQKTVSADASALLQDLVGNSVQDLARALEKLALFVGERKNIDQADVETIISRLRSESIFELTDHIGAGKRGSALVALNQLMESGEPPLLILSMITRHFRILLLAHTLLGQSASPEELRRKLALQKLVVPSFVVSKLLVQAPKFSRKKLEQCFARLWETDRAIKSQRTPASLLMESLVLDLCGQGWRDFGFGFGFERQLRDAGDGIMVL